jgi:hypothetical protein
MRACPATGALDQADLRTRLHSPAAHLTLPSADCAKGTLLPIAPANAVAAPFFVRGAADPQLDPRTGHRAAAREASR